MADRDEWHLKEDLKFTVFRRSHVSRLKQAFAHFTIFNSQKE